MYYIKCTHGMVSCERRHVFPLQIGIPSVRSLRVEVGVCQLQVGLRSLLINRRQVGNSA